MGQRCQIKSWLLHFDGIFVLRTDARMTPLNTVLRDKELLTVEDLFRRAKVQMRTRPIYHPCDAAIRAMSSAPSSPSSSRRNWPTVAALPASSSNGTT